MKRQFCTRLTRLEAFLTPDAVAPLVIVAHPLSPDQRADLSNNERIVLDGYCYAGLVITARERLTSDPDDAGVRCAPGEYVEDVIRDIHQNCCYRRSEESCRVCVDTPLAGT